MRFGESHGTSAADFESLPSDPPIDPAATMIRLRELLAEAEAFVFRMPTEKVGLLFLEDGKIVQPDPYRLSTKRMRDGGVAIGRRAWRSSPPCSSARWIVSN